MTVTNVTDTSTTTNIDNKKIRDEQLKSNCEKYRKSIYDSVNSNNQNDVTIISSIQLWAKDLEELFELHDQAWYIPNIASEIVASLKTIGFPEAKFNYVHEALSSFGNKYVRHIDHSTITSQSKLDNHLELLYRTKAKIYYDALEVLSSFQPSELLREDAQKIGEKSIDVKDKIIELDEKHNIPVCANLSFDFEGIEDKFQEPVTYPETKPAWTIVCEAESRNIDARKDRLDRMYKEGKESIDGIILLDDKTLELIAEAIDADTHLMKPFTDRKWRKNILQWFDIVQHSVDWFKHSASTKFKTPDLHGFYRELTREQIGAKKEPLLIFAKKIVELTPYLYLFNGIMWQKTCDPNGSRFSTDLSPKLSDRSIK